MIGPRAAAAGWLGTAGIVSIGWLAVAGSAAGSGQGAARVDPATAAAVRGKVTLQGTPPKNAAIRMNADPNCLKATAGQEQQQETFAVGPAGTLQNVFVYVKDGLGRYTYDAPKTPVVIDQQQCRYHPHVFGIRVGQPLKGMKTTRTFTTREVMVPIRCDVHGWMNAYVGVLDHPYFAVSGADGTFEIASLPPGTYTLEAWHEKLGTMTQQVVVTAKQAKDVTFVFKVS